MQTEIGWHEITVRLLCAVIAGALIGFNREEHGHAAGLRTTLLVCLAAAIAMIQVNLLLDLTGKASDSFVVMDLMRLPLGILSGIGFIGAGAILRRDNLVVGVTTAASLWFVTVMGLCFGGGQIGLGAAALVLGFGTLTGLKWTERLWKQKRFATLTIAAGATPPAEAEIAGALASGGYHARLISIVYGDGKDWHELTYEMRWHGRFDDKSPALFLQQFTERFSPGEIIWKDVASR